MAKIKAGSGISVITPRVGSAMVGYANRSGPSIGVHDDLHSRTVVVDGEDAIWALSAFELCELSARQVALDSITLVKDEDGSLPLSADLSILVVYPRGGAGLGQAVRELAPQAALLEVGETPTSREFATAAVLAASADVVVLGTRDVMDHPGQAKLVESLAREHPVVAVALDSPYDLLSYPEVSTYLATYGRAAVSMEALAQVLFGIVEPTGRLPVELPGLYEVGHNYTLER